MKLKVKVDANGVAYVAAIDPSTGEHRKSTTVPQGQEVELTIPAVNDANGIEFGEVVSSDAEAPAEEPQGGGEAPQGGESGGEQPEGAGGGETPADGGQGEQGGTEAPTTSAASEKPLYIVDGDTIPEGFTESGLETPEGRTLFHFGNDTAGQSATGNVDGVSVYADADDNEQPVQAVTPAEPSA
ncbi:MAG TPA: hypothetical protein VN752_06740 [Solirubrobacterales bacterium]|nr:hypothetical protein [Solirubrobacterales bacterium]